MRQVHETGNGEYVIDFDETGVTVRLYDEKGKWRATSGIGIASNKGHWSTWCADLEADNWTTIHIDKEKRDVQNPSS